MFLVPLVAERVIESLFGNLPSLRIFTFEVEPAPPIVLRTFSSSEAAGEPVADAINTDLILSADKLDNSTELKLGAIAEPFEIIDSLF